MPSNQSQVASKASGGGGGGDGNKPSGARLLWRFLLFFAFVAATVVVLVAFLGRALAAKYPRMVQDNRFDIDEVPVASPLRPHVPVTLACLPRGESFHSTNAPHWGAPSIKLTLANHPPPSS